MATLERTYTIPLRKEWIKAPKYRRAKKSIKALREFLARHMKTDFENVRIGTQLNLEIWKHGIKNPPSRVRVNVQKDDKGIVTAELFGHKIAQKKEKTEEKGKMAGMAGKIAEKIKGAVTTKPESSKPLIAKKASPSKPEISKPARKPKQEKPAAPAADAKPAAQAPNSAPASSSAAKPAV